MQWDCAWSNMAQSTSIPFRGFPWREGKIHPALQMSPKGRRGKEGGWIHPTAWRPGTTTGGGGGVVCVYVCVCVCVCGGGGGGGGGLGLLLLLVVVVVVVGWGWGLGCIQNQRSTSRPLWSICYFQMRWGDLVRTNTRRSEYDHTLDQTTPMIYKTTNSRLWNAHGREWPFSG